MRASCAVVATALTITTSASADDWRASASTGLIILGPPEYPTGGIMPEVGVERTIGGGAGYSVGAAASCGAFGFGNFPGVLCGVTPTLTAHPAKSLHVPLTLGVDIGRIPVCNTWGMCFYYIGVYPEASVGMRYDVRKTWSAELRVRARYVSTYGWSGISWQPTASVATSF